MVCVSCSTLKSKTFKRQDGTQEVFESYDVLLSDGLDSVLAETSKVVTTQLKQTPLKVGASYSCRIKLNVREYKKDNGEIATFFGATLLDIALKYDV